MSGPGLLVPQAVEAVAHPFKRLGLAFGSRFFVLLAVGAMWIGPGLFQPRFFYAMVGWDVLVVAAWLIDFSTLPSPAQLSVRRSWLSPAALSVPSQVRVALFNRSTRTIRAHILDNVPHQVRAEPARVEIVVGPNATAEADYRILPRMRGEAIIGNVYIRYQSPLRIAERWATAELIQTITTYPNLDEAKRESIYLARGRQIELERRSRRIRGAGRAFESLRDYCEGDDFRDICWTASARRGKLITRLYELERSQAIWIVIDSGRLMRTRVDAATKLDHAVNAALTLSQVAMGSGDRVGILAYGRRVRHALPAARGTSHLRQIIEHLAIVRAEESEADHLLAAGRLLTDQKRRSLVVWMTDVSDSAMTPEVVQAASRLMPRHLVLFVVIGQPDLTRTALRKPVTTAEMYHTAAAQEVLLRREVLLAGLRARGALALEASSKLSPTVVNLYLDVKQRSRL